MSAAATEGRTDGSPAASRVPRLGFLGVGWIGRSRMEGLISSGRAAAVGIADADPEAADAALALAPEAARVEGLDGLLELEPDGIVIATPSALHAEQAIRALERGAAVFCQKPLARDREEAAGVVEAARRADRLLGVDLSYRHTAAARELRSALRNGAIGTPFAAELAFHNAYGPDKPWFKDRRLAGGGCLVDLGTHLVDLARWLTGCGPSVRSARVLHRGEPLRPGTAEVEDYAEAELVAGGLPVRIACSWWLSVGADCRIEVLLHGTDGSLAMENVGGSFYDFRAELRRGTQVESLAEPPDEWGPRALTAWAERLGQDGSFDPAAEELVGLTGLLDDVYAKAGAAGEGAG